MGINLWHWQCICMATLLSCPTERPGHQHYDLISNSIHYPGTEPTSPVPILIMPNTWLGSDTYQFLSHQFDWIRVWTCALESLNLPIREMGNQLEEECVCCLLWFYILTTSHVISGSCDIGSAHSWRLHSDAPHGDQAAGITHYPFSYIILILS